MNEPIPLREGGYEGDEEKRKELFEVRIDFRKISRWSVWLAMREREEEGKRFQ